MQRTDSEIIDALGGTLAAASLCEVSPPSVSEWRKKGIPKARRMFLRSVRPDLFTASQPSPHDPQQDQARAA
jgi:hypothetical protein